MPGFIAGPSFSSLERSVAWWVRKIVVTLGSVNRREPVSAIDRYTTTMIRSRLDEIIETLLNGAGAIVIERCFDDR